jgi:hypothetical protein
MRLEIIVPDNTLTPARRSRYAQLAEQLETQPEFIDALPINVGNDHPVSRGKATDLAPLTDDELRQFDELFPNFCVTDVTDEQWQQIEKGTRRMRKEGLPARA